MLVQKRHSGEGLGTVFALVFFHIRMGLQVSPEVGPVSKSPVAVGAGKWLLSCQVRNKKWMSVITQR